VNPSTTTRRHFLGGMTALGAAVGAGRDVFAARHDTEDGRPAREATAIENEAAAFANPLRLPGASGLYGVMRATDLREVRVVRSEIEVLPGKRTPYLAYAVESGGKTYLNPALLARRGEEMRLRMVNQLDEPTIIHWHGLSNDARNDGNGLIVAAPGQAYEYAFKLHDRASMYWYHPHPHGFIPQQAYHGLASLLFVEDDEELALRDALGLALGDTEIPLVLQDRTFDAQGRLRYQPSTEQAFQGFIGDRLLVNLTEQAVFQAARRIYRFRILNGSNARTYRLAFLQEGRPLGCYLAGTDGGLLAAVQRIEQAYISPGQRLDILLDLREAKAGRPVTLGTLGFDPMHAEGAAGASMAGMDHSKMAMPQDAGAAMAMGGEGVPHALLRIDVKASPDYTKKIPAALSALPAVKLPSGAPRRIKLAHDGKGRWTINGWTYDPKSVPLTVKRGAAETWLIENERASMPHPMHIHGFQFRVVERRGSPPQVRALAGSRGLMPQDLGVTDTVQVWPGEAVRIALDFSHSHAGSQDYVFHCHNLEHAEAGMMIRYRVQG
jgi:blue copper oxidase